MTSWPQAGQLQYGFSPECASQCNKFSRRAPHARSHRTLRTSGQGAARDKTSETTGSQLVTNIFQPVVMFSKEVNRVLDRPFNEDEFSEIFPALGRERTTFFRPFPRALRMTSVVTIDHKPH